MRSQRYTTWPATIALAWLALGARPWRDAQAPVLEDPFQQPRRARTAAERQAVRAAELEPGRPTAAVTVRLGARTVVLVRGWRGHGTGGGQLGYLAYTVADGRPARLVWAGVYAEYLALPQDGVARGFTDYTMEGCLLVAGERLGYVARGRPPRRGIDDALPAPADGYFAWSAASRTFERVAAPDEPLRARCAAMPSWDVAR